MNPLEITYTIALVVTFYVVFARMKAHEARLTRLEARKPEPEKRVQAPAYEKPVVPGTKETTSLQIGGGKLNADQENHVYEWA